MNESREQHRPAARRGRGAVDYGMLRQLVGYELRRAQARVFADFMGTMADDGVTPGQFGVLVLIATNPGSSQSAIAEALGIERSTMVAVIDGLQARGLVVRETAAGDRRSYALRLTRQGAALLARLEPMVRAHERRIAAALSEEEKQALIGLLRRIGTR